VLRYTKANWGLEQRNLYADRLMTIVRDLRAYPEPGSARDDIAPGLRIRRVGQHVIFYRAYPESIRIIRILHAKMDPSTHLRDQP
jgi:plasmid stabilization system protein ParE